MKKINGSRAKAIKTAIEKLGGLMGFSKALSKRLSDKNQKKQRLTQKQCYLRAQKWLLYGVATRLVLDVEAVSGVSRHDLDPELYPNE